MNRKLTTNVTVTNPETGETRTFSPEDELPDWAGDAITNPKVWDDYVDPDAPEDEDAPKSKRSRKAAASDE